MDAHDAHDAHTLEVKPSEPSEPSEASDNATRPLAERGARIGRFLVLEELGRGAMGVVLAAYDPELQRRVALKLHKPHGANPLKARARLAREAQALARLDHPNVVTVYDVGIHEGQVFVAMAYVEGQTLAAWIAAAPAEGRPWRAVLEVLVAAAEGLAAAHAEGLVHRDFKPANVMLGADGRPQVMDFGLARLQGLLDDEREPTLSDELARLQENSFDSQGSQTLTATGSVIGTPAYMSPEQFLGQPATVLSDQFGFCVALHEALYGARPFQGKGYKALAHAVLHGELVPPSTRGRAPRWLYAIVCRGLARDPQDRFPSLQELLAALAHHEQRVRRTRRLGVVVSLALVVAAAVGATRQQQRQREQTCEDRAALVDELWTPAARAELEQHLLAADPESAPLVAKTLPWLDGHAEDLRAAAREVCARETLREQWSPAQAAKARWCLEGRRMQLAATIDAFARIDAALPSRAVSLAAGLTPPAECLDEASLAQAPAPPSPEVRARVEAALARLAEVRYLRSAGEPQPALALAEELRPEVEALAWPPLEVRLLVERALLHEDLGQLDEAATLGEQAFFAAATHDDWAPAADIASRLIQVFGHNLAKPEQGQRWSNLASLAIVHAGDPLGHREARRLTGVAALAFSEQRYAEARAAFSAALAGYEAALGAHHPTTAAVLHNLAMCHRSEGDHARALDLFRRERDILVELYGPSHRAYLTAQESIATTHMWMRELDAATRLLEQVIVELEARYGPQYLDLGMAYGHLATVAELDARYAEAAELQRRSLEILAHNLGPAHPWVGTAHLGLARVAMFAGDPETGEREARRTLEIYARHHGEDSPRLAGVRARLGLALLELGRHAEAFEQIERGRAYPIDAVDPEIRADLDLTLARLLWDPPADLGPGRAQDRDRARELLADARRSYLELGVEGERGLAALAAWAETVELELAGL